MRAGRLNLAIVLQGLALLALLLALLPALREARQSRGTADDATVVLLDRSSSAPAEAVEAQFATLQAELRTLRRRWRPLEFARAPVLADGAALDPTGTNIEQALYAALALTRAPAGETPAGRIVVISDGHATEGDTRAALLAARDAGVELQWRVVASPPQPRIERVFVPPRAALGEQLAFEVELGDAPPGTTLVAWLGESDATGLASLSVGDDPAAGRRLRGSLPLTQAGSVPLQLELRAAADDRVLHSRRPAAMVEVGAASSILHLAGTSSQLASSLRRGGWSVETVPVEEIDAQASRIAGRDLVILEDVAIAAAHEPFWTALVAALRAGDIGLLVCGLEGAWASGGYRGSPLESVLPLQSVPAALGETTTVVFAIDKSGSMGERSAGVDRFRLARRAVRDTAASLGERDSAAIVVFDVEARTIAQLDAAPRVAERAAREWPVSPRGGTALVAGIDAALAQFARADDTGRRILILVTDGFVGEASPLAMRARLSEAGVELIALAVGPDADARALAQLSAGGASRVLRVAEVAQLPQLMLEGLTRTRAPIERGRLPVRSLAPFGSLSTSTEWPALAAYAVTTARDEATVLVESGRGDPVVARGTAGLGSVMAVATSFDAPAREWLAWPRWPELAAALMPLPSVAAGEQLTLRAGPGLDAIEVEVDAARAGAWLEASEGWLQLIGPDGRLRREQLHGAGPGRLQARVPTTQAGLYRLVAVVEGQRQSASLLYSRTTERSAAGVNPQLAQWQSEGLLQIDTADGTAGAGVGVGMGAIGDAWTLPEQHITLIAAVLFLLGVLADRWRDLRRDCESLRTQLRGIAPRRRA